MPRHWDPTNRPTIVVARTPTSDDDAEWFPVRNATATVDEDRDDVASIASSVASVASSVACHCASAELCTCRGGYGSQGRRGAHHTRHASPPSGVKPYNRRRGADADTDSNESRCGSDEQERNSSVLDLDESDDVTGTQADSGGRDAANDSLGNQRFAATSRSDLADQQSVRTKDQLPDFDEADDVMQKAAKIRGCRLHNLFVISFLLAFGVFCFVFIMIETEYSKSLEVTGRTSTLDAAIKYSNRFLETMDLIESNSQLGLIGYEFSEKVKHMNRQTASAEVGFASATMLNETLATIVCTSHLGLSQFVILEMSTDNDTFGSTGSASNATGTSMSPTESHCEIVASGKCSARLQEEGISTRGPIFSFTPETEDALFSDNPQTVCPIVFNTTTSIQYASGDTDSLRWIVHSPKPSVRAAFGVLRSSFQQALYGFEAQANALGTVKDVNIATGLLWNTPKQSVNSTGGVVMKMVPELVSANVGAALPTEELKGAMGSMLQTYCNGGYTHTWHVPFTVRGSMSKKIQVNVDRVVENLPEILVTDTTTTGYGITYVMCVVYCIVRDGNKTHCNLTDPSEEKIFSVIRTELSTARDSNLIRAFNGAVVTALVTIFLFNVYFHFSIALPVKYLHKRIVSTLTSKQYRPKKLRRILFRISQPLWVGDIKAIISAFTIMSVFFTETRKHMPEHLRRMQLKKLRDAESLIDMIHGEEEKEKAQLAGRDSRSSVSSPTDVEETAPSPGPDGRLNHHVILTHQALLRHATFRDQPTRDEGQVDFEMEAIGSQSISQLNQQLGLDGTVDPVTPTVSFRFAKDPKGIGESDLSMIDSVTIMVIHIGYIEDAFKMDFAGAERQHRQIVGTLLAIIRRHHGAVFTRRGESMGVCWNAFESIANHIHYGVRCAREIASIFEAVKEQGLSIGIALNCGPCIAGTLGDSGFIMNVAFGDTISKTFLIAELSKQLSCASMLITESVKTLIGNRYECVVVDVLKWNEHGETETLFDIRLDTKDSDPPVNRRLPMSKSRRGNRKRDFLLEYTTAFGQFRQHQFGPALATLSALTKEFGDNRLITRLRTICHYCDMNATNSSLLPKPYFRKYPEWNMYEKVVGRALLEQHERAVKSGSTQEREELVATLNSLDVQKQSSDYSVVIPSPSTAVGCADAHVDHPVFKSVEAEQKLDMEAFRKDLEQAVKAAKGPASALKPPSNHASPPPITPNGEMRPDMLVDSLYDLRASTYQESYLESPTAQPGVGAVNTRTGVSGSSPPDPSTPGDQSQNTNEQGASSDQGFDAVNGEEGLAGSVLRRGTLGGTLATDMALVMDPRDMPTKITAHKGTVYTRSSHVLGTGSYGCVYLGLEEHTGKFAAMKFLPLPTGDQERDLIINEVHIMQTVRDAHIVEFYDFAVVCGRIVLMMECVVPGSLSSMLKNFESLSPVTTVHFMKDILKGLNKLHSRGIMHRDVKPQNVLITSNGSCKISDFGASAALGEFVRNNSTGIVVGTPLYMAPEAARGSATEASDIWSVGIMFLELITGKVPYEMTGDLQSNPALFVYRIGAGLLTPKYSADDMSQVTLDFVTRCLMLEPSERSTAAELLTLPFFLV